MTHAENPYVLRFMFVAIFLSVLTGWLVNQGPKVAARTFDPTTGGVLRLLWAMIIAIIINFGFRLPSIDLRASAPKYLSFTFGGYACILALMTGIEIFANLVAAYDGPCNKKTEKPLAIVPLLGIVAKYELF